MDINLYNTETKKKEKFKPLKKDHVSIYSCGPTVYWFQHIGNLRTYIFTDILRKTFEFNGYQVKHVINVTDVGHLTSDSDTGDDKMESAAKKENKSAKEIAQFYFNSFIEDLVKLNIKMPYKWPKASEHIEEQIEMIKTLEKKGFTYKTSDGIYFDTSKYKEYGKLINKKLENIEAGKRVSIKEKKNDTDFALWKFSENKGKRQQEWESPWGLGFPGWHIECSAMSIKYLGKTIDIHTGGQEHIAIHHTNEIAQSECCYNQKFVNYWMHTAWLLNESGEKVSKSKGGLYTLSDLEKKGFNSLDFRYLCLQTAYRKPLKFSLESLRSSKKALENIKEKISKIKSDKKSGKDLSEKYYSEFKDAINDDINVPKALAIFQKAIEDKEFDSNKKIKLLEEMDKVLGLNISKIEKRAIKEIPEELKKLLEKRDLLRKEKKYQEADTIRDEIISKGYEVIDK